MVKVIVAPLGFERTSTRDGLRLPLYPPAQVVLPGRAAGGVAHPRAPPSPIVQAAGKSIVAIGYSRGAAARTTIGLTGQTIEIIVTEVGHTTPRVSLRFQVAGVVVSVHPIAHVGIAHRDFAPQGIVVHGGLIVGSIGHGLEIAQYIVAVTGGGEV
ncbi:MAG: hypothetical protein BWY63_03330 [Chloroflexi bacterium ADurb.Bin360]|nr:MAG: hypothetical protein BWY63_03330 [Chloroflexi bacterium ADurb.Bin360]